MKCTDCGYESDEPSDWFTYDLCTDCAVDRGYIERGIMTELGREFKKQHNR